MTSRQAGTRVTGLQEYEAELRAAEAELRDEEAKARQAGAALEEAQAELGELRQQAGELAALEEQYWHTANDLGLALRAHSQQRTSLQRKASHTHCITDLLQGQPWIAARGRPLVLIADLALGGAPHPAASYQCVQ